MERIIVQISKQGGVKVKVDGCSGPSCSDLTKALENALGKTTGDEKTSEYYEEQQTNENRQTLGN